MVDLGAGNDQLQILNPQSGGDPHLTANVTLTTGTGADAISFVDTLCSANVTVTDFDPTQDIRQYYGVHKLSDIDVATGDASGVTLVEGDLTLILQGGTLSELTNAVFVPI